MRHTSEHAGDASKQALRKDGHEWFPEGVPYRPFDKLTTAELGDIFDAAVRHRLLDSELLFEAIEKCSRLTCASRIHIQAAIRTKLRSLPGILPMPVLPQAAAPVERGADGAALAGSGMCTHDVGVCKVACISRVQCKAGIKHSHRRNAATRWIMLPHLISMQHAGIAYEHHRNPDVEVPVAGQRLLLQTPITEAMVQAARAAPELAGLNAGKDFTCVKKFRVVDIVNHLIKAGRLLCTVLEPVRSHSAELCLAGLQSCKQLHKALTPCCCSCCCCCCFCCCWRC